MSHSTRPRSLSYPDAIRLLFQDQAVVTDLKNACHKLAHILVSLMDTFEGISVQMHTFDLQGITAPLKSRWNSIRADFANLVWQFRANASSISGRLKMFCTLILPLTLRNANDRSSRLHVEKLSVLRSYMDVGQTNSLASRAIELADSLNLFHTELCKLVSHRATSGQHELREVASKLTQLVNIVRQLYSSSAQLTHPDITYLSFSVLRAAAASGISSRQSRLSHYHLALDGNLSAMKLMFESLDHTRSEVAHRQYVAQVAHRQNDVITTSRTAVHGLLLDQLGATEAFLTFLLAIWSRLRADCANIQQWLHNPVVSETPLCVTMFMSGGHTVYASVADCLGVFVAGIDPSHFDGLVVV